MRFVLEYIEYIRMDSTNCHCTRIFTRLVQFCQGKTKLNKLTNVNENLLITRLGSKKKELHNTISSHRNCGCCDVVDELCVSDVGKIDVLQRKIGETRLSGNADTSSRRRRNEDSRTSDSSCALSLSSSAFVEEILPKS